MNPISFWPTPQTQSVRGCEKGVVAMHWDMRCSYRFLKCNYVKASLETTPGRGRCSLSDYKGVPTGSVGKGKGDIGEGGGEGEGEGGNTLRHSCHAHFLAISLTYDFFPFLFFPSFFYSRQFSEETCCISQKSYQPF